LLTIFYIYDQYSGYIGGDPNKPSHNEIELIKNADLVFVLSKKLQQDKKKYRDDIHHLPNAANFHLFSKSRLESTIVPADLSKIPGPRIGYIGTCNEKLNVKLLDFLSNIRPNWSIVLVGRENYSLSEEKNNFIKLINKKNVFWLGNKKHDSIPAYIKGLDICLMSYIVNNWTFYGDPSKMHEYLASGKPTIASDLYSIREYANVIDIPETDEDWIKIIDFRLNESNPNLVQERIKIANENSYEARIDKAMHIIKYKLEEKYA